MPRQRSIQRRRIAICWRTSLIVLKCTCNWHVLEDPIFYGQWANAWLVWFLKYTTRVKLSNIVMWEILHDSAGWDCFRTQTLPRSWRFKIDFRGNFVHIWKSHVCANKVDVQEANVSYTQFNGIWNYFSWCRSTHGWNSRSWSLGFGY